METLSDVITEEDKDFLPQEYLEDRELRKKVMDSINSLPKKRRYCLVLYFYEDMSYSEIASIMDVSIGTVATNIMRGKETILKNFNLHGESTGDLKVAQSMVALPIIKQILDKEADVMFPSEAVNSLIDTVIGSLSQVALKTAGVAVASKAVVGGTFVTKTIATIVTVTLVVSTGTATLVNYKNSQNKPSAKSSAEKNLNLRDSRYPVTTPGGMDGEHVLNPPEPQDDDNQIPFAQFGVLLKNNDCNCGHVNPKEMELINSDDTEVRYTWIIYDNDDNEIYTGENSDGRKEFNSLYKNKKKGTYTIVIDCVDQHENSATIKKSFIIDTDEIIDGEYS